MAEDDARRRAAVERLTNKRDFTSNVVAYVAVNTLLVVIWAATGGGYFWPIWPIAGWGIGLAIHGWNTYGQRPITEEDIRNEMDRGVG